MGDTRNTVSTPATASSSVSGKSMSATTGSTPGRSNFFAPSGPWAIARTGTPRSARCDVTPPPNMPFAPVTRIIAAQRSIRRVVQLDLGAGPRQELLDGAVDAQGGLLEPIDRVGVRA